MIASRHGDFPVKKGDKLAGTRIIPLVIEKEKMDRAAEVVGTEPIFSILPYNKKKVGIVTTGSEVQKGLITDTFTPVPVSYTHLSQMKKTSSTRPLTRVFVSLERWKMR